MSSKSSLERARRFLDERNIRIINQSPIGTKVYLDYINPEGKLIKYETIVTANERSDLMTRSRAYRLSVDALLDLVENG